MAFQAVPNTIECDVRGQLFGQLIENTLYLRMAAPPTAGDVADAAAVVRGWWFASIMGVLSLDYSFREVFAKDLTVEGGAEVHNIAGAGTAGSFGVAALPGNVSFAISFSTGLAGRSNRGRNYIPCLAESQVTGNTVSTGTVTAFMDAYNALLTELAASDFTWVVVSRVADHVIRAVGVTNPVIVALATDIFVDSMRRRLTGRGN
jgi:hypothetical protein